jgi:hypothetical protein
MKIVLLVAFYGICSGLTAGAASITRGPYLQSAAADRITVCWRTDVATTSEVSYGLAAESLGTPVVVPGTRTDHAVTLTGLPPATRHYYRIQGSADSGTPVNVSGPSYWFNTSPATGSASPTRIWVVGDSGYQSNDPITSRDSYMNATAAGGKRTDLFMMLGDNAYATGTDNQYQAAVFWRYQTLLKNTPLWSTIGNHDDTSVPAVPPAPYYSIFTFPITGECGGVPSGTEKYYSFNYGNIHFICLDSNTYASVSDIPGGTYGMVDWLRDDLAACTSDWIVAFMHQGPYSRGTHLSDTEQELFLTRQHIVPLLEQYGADLVLYGHSHAYERSRFIDGHYGLSTTWNGTTMVKQGGNGSVVGGVDAAGNFDTLPAAANGAYQKPAATARSGAVYSVVGASSSAQGWKQPVSSALVHPSPHPAHLVNLNLMGSMVLEIDGNRLNAQYFDINGALRDDFTILKGATYTLQPSVPTTEGSLSGVAFPVTRTGSTAFAEEVPVAVNLISGEGVTPSQGLAVFAAGQSSTEVKFFPAGSDPETRFEARLLPTTRSVQLGAAPRAAYRISGGPQPGYFGPTDPISAATWYASRFGAPPSGPAVWVVDDDGDGLSLLLEYALGGEPGPNDSALLPQAKVEGGSFIYRYTRPPGRSDLGYQILGSADLSTWPLPALSDVNDGPVTALGEPRKVELPAASPLKFVRMKIGLLP